MIYSLSNKIIIASFFTSILLVAVLVVGEINFSNRLVVTSDLKSVTKNLGIARPQGVLDAAGCLRAQELSFWIDLPNYYDQVMLNMSGNGIENFEAGLKYREVDFTKNIDQSVFNLSKTLHHEMVFRVRDGVRPGDVCLHSVTLDFTKKETNLLDYLKLWLRF